MDRHRRGAQTKWSLGKGLGAPVPSLGPLPSLDLHVLFNTEAPWTPVSRDFHDILVLQPWLIINSVPIFSSFCRWWGGGACWLKKKWIMWELLVKVYLGKNEDCSPGDSTSNSSEELIQRGQEEKDSVYVILVKGGCLQSNTYFSIKFLLVSWSFASHKKWLSPWRVLVLF